VVILAIGSSFCMVVFFFLFLASVIIGVCLEIILAGVRPPPQPWYMMYLRW
jgi:hypothetical protein